MKELNKKYTNNLEKAAISNAEKCGHTIKPTDVVNGNVKSPIYNSFIAGAEFHRDNEMFDAMQYYLEYVEKNGYTSPREWFLYKRHYHSIWETDGEFKNRKVYE